MTGSSYGQQQGYGNPPSDVASSANACIATLEKIKEKKAAAEAEGKFYKQSDDRNELDCLALEYTASKNNEKLNSPRESTSTLDKKIVCQMKAGYTLDYTACTNTIRTYDALAILEQGMFQSQQMDMNHTQQSIQANTNAQIAKDGDVTSAALGAQKDQTLKAKELNEQQAASYAAATMALAAAINGWPSESDTGISKICSGMKSKAESSDCFKQITRARDAQKKTVFANSETKKAFIGAAIQFAKKGGLALIEAIRLGLQAEQIQKVKDAAAANDDTPQFSPCMSDPTLPDCAPVGPGPRVSGANFGGGDFGVSDTNSNAFNMGNGTDSTFGDAGAATDIKEKPNASSVSSPFADMAKQANSILDPAAAANMTPGGNSGGAGGGGGGGMGGGSASLGNDLKGVDPDENKEKDIKTSEVSGNYSQGGGAGFKGIKSGADETFNPYGNLLDAKSQNGGAVVEDRSIASEGKPFTSGLFERLSSRYDQAVKSKKIEPKYEE